MSKFVSDFLSVLRSKVFHTILGIGTSVIIARVLGPEGNGLLAGVLIYPNIFVSFATLGLKQATVYYVGNDKVPTHVVFTTIIVVWVFTSTFSVIVCIYILKVVAGNVYTYSMIVLAVSPIPLQLYKDYLSGVLIGKESIKKFARVTWLPGLFKFIGAGIFVYYLNLGVKGALIAPIISWVIICIVITLIVRPFITNRIRFDANVTKDMVKLGAVYSISLFIINLNYKVDQMLLEYMGTTYDLGIYARGAGLIERVWQIPMVLGTIIFAGSANAKNSKEYSLKIMKLLRVSLVVCLFAILVLSIFSDKVVLLLYGSKFLDSSYVIRYLAVGVFFMVFFKILNMDLAGRGKPWLSMYAMLPSVIVNIILNILLIPNYGSAGVAFASSISYTLAAVIFLFVYMKSVHISFKAVLYFKKDDIKLIMNRLKKFQRN